MRALWVLSDFAIATQPHNLMCDSGRGSRGMRVTCCRATPPAGSAIELCFSFFFSRDAKQFFYAKL